MNDKRKQVIETSKGVIFFGNVQKLEKESAGWKLWLKPDKSSKQIGPQSLVLSFWT